MGIDCSTKSMAFCVFYNRRPEKWGKIHFRGADIYERVGEAGAKVRALKETLDADYVVLEGAIMVASQKVAIDMAYVFGAVLGSLLNSGNRVVTVSPLQWQSTIQNKVWTKEQKAKLKLEVPGKSDTWYKGEIRKRRKQYTIDYFNKKWPHMALDDDDVADACGIAYHAYTQLTRRS
jgi:Holliday junction resolvasome RuvABC endonuclease subunit